MALMDPEAVVLRTYPLREADLLVTLFTRAEGKAAGSRVQQVSLPRVLIFLM